MKTVLTTVAIFLLGLGAAAQETVESRKTYELLNENLVKTTIYTDGRIEQTGYYTILGNDLIKHGEWRIYLNGKIVSRAMFNTGQLVWVDTSEGRVTSEQIRVRKLERKVERLERLVAATQP